MNPDKKINQILSEAEKLKKEEQQKLEKEKKKIVQKPKGLMATPPHDETWRVYRALNSKSIGLLWLLPLSLIPVVYIMYTNETDKLVRYLTIIIAIPLIRWIYLKIMLYSGYSKFRKWRSKLPFELIGWEQTVDTEHFHNLLYWRLEASLEIDFETNDKFNENVLADMLLLFCKKTKNAFYTPEFAISGFAGDPRKHWTVEKNIAKGSLNNEVVFYIYKFLLEELATLALEYKNIKKVILITSKKEYKIEPERVSSD
jgi:hypothetical protein